MPAQFSKPDVLGFAMRLKEQREAQAIARRKSQVDAINAIASMKLDAAKEQRESELHRLTIQEREAALQEKRFQLRELGDKSITTARESVDDALMSDPMNAFKNVQAIGQGEMSVRGVDPALATSTGAAPTAIEGALVGGFSPAASRESIRTGKAADAKLEDARQAKIGTVMGEVEASRRVQREITNMKRERARMQKAGAAPSEIADLTRDIEVTQDLLRNQREENVGRTAGWSESTRENKVEQYGSTMLAANFMDRVLSGVEDGKFGLGVSAKIQGFMTNLGEMAGDIVRMVGSDPGGSTEVLQGFQNALERKDSTFSVLDENGEVLELNTLEVSLAYFWVKANRGNTARFAIQEYKDARKELGLTNAGDSQLSVLRSMRTLNELIDNQAKNVEASAKVAREPLSTLNTLREIYGAPDAAGRRKRIEALTRGRKPARRAPGGKEPEDTAGTMNPAALDAIRAKRKTAADILRGGGR